MTPEQLAAYERKRVTQIGRVTQAQKTEMAATWNGSNCEPVNITSGGVEADTRAVRSNVRPVLGPPRADSPSAYAALGRADGTRSSAGVAPGPLTLYPLINLCRAVKIAEPVPEYRFHTRKWRFDYAWPAHLLAMEIDGGVWTQGRHSRGAGKIADMEKLSEAAILGWRVLYAVPDDLSNGLALDRVMRALTDRQAA